MPLLPPPPRHRVADVQRVHIPLRSAGGADAIVDPLTDPDVDFVHGDLDLPPKSQYMYQLKEWCLASEEKIKTEGSEIPKGLSQGDLYRVSSRDLDTILHYFDILPTQP